MPYRDELEAAHARIASLETELAEERAKSQALVKREPSTPAKGRGTSLDRGAAGPEAAQRYLGAPNRLEFERVLDGELPEEAHTELVEHIRRSVGTVGATTVLPGSLAWTANAPNNGMGPFANIYFTSRKGKTTIRAEEKLGNLAGGIFGGVGGGVGGSGIILPIATAWINPLLAAVAIPAWLGSIYWGCRKLYKGSAKKHAERLETLLDELTEIAQRYIDEAANESE
jgi:hypothetical protein